MAKFYGNIGFVTTQETDDGSGIWKPIVVERKYAGDILRLSRKWDAANKTNDDISINQQLSIIADPFFYQNIGYIRYAEVYGTKWKITNIEPAYPRLILDLGDLYNE